MATIQQIIGKVNPKLYAENGKELLKKYRSADKIPADEVKPQAIKYSKKDDAIKPNLKGDEASHRLIYDSTSETLEPIYFFILDIMNSMGLSPEKLVDNFVSSPGSGHFAELGQRATIMQQQGSRILGDVNTVLRSVLNIIYDLRDFKIRLQYYNDLKSSDKGDAEAARLSLKQIWMDKVDIAKGNSSIKAMAVQGGFQTLIDAFLAANSVEDVNKLDLNDIVKRVLKPRLQELNIWIRQSEKELRKRYELERIYLKSQVNSLKLYSRWAKPYLKAAQQLEMKEAERSPDLIKVFNTILLELTLLGKSKIDIIKSIDTGDLPPELKKIAKAQKRDYYSCILVEFAFRGIPSRISPQQAHYSFGGRTEVSFKAYALNDDELNKIEEELKKSDIEDVLKLIEGTTTESLGELQEEINSFLEEPEKFEAEGQEKKKKSGDASNPFLALLGVYNKKSEAREENKGEVKLPAIRPDNFIEKTHLRSLSISKAVDTAFSLFDLYKKAHGMPSYT